MLHVGSIRRKVIIVFCIFIISFYFYANNSFQGGFTGFFLAFIVEVVANVSNLLLFISSKPPLLGDKVISILSNMGCPQCQTQQAPFQLYFMMNPSLVADILGRFLPAFPVK